MSVLNQTLATLRDDAIDASYYFSSRVAASSRDRHENSIGAHALNFIYKVNNEDVGSKAEAINGLANLLEDLASSKLEAPDVARKEGFEKYEESEARKAELAKLISTLTNSQPFTDFLLGLNKIILDIKARVKESLA